MHCQGCILHPTLSGNAARTSLPIERPTAARQCREGPRPDVRSGLSLVSFVSRVRAHQRKQENMTNQLGLEEALNELEAEGASPRQRPADHVITALPIKQISKRTAVFQPRTLDGHRADDEEFIRDLAKVLKNSDGKAMDAITVWYGGSNFYVIDGHHRLEAYKR